MRFWDASALMAAMTREPASPRVAPLMKADSAVVVWWASPVECASAVSRRHREGVVGSRGVETLLRSLREAAEHWQVISPSAAVRDAAIRLVRVHPLGAADALQLAAALAWAEDRPEGREFVVLDQRLADASAREGFVVLPAAESPGS